MDKAYIVFGGWGFSPDILRPVFGDQSHYIDVNKIMPLLFNEMELLPNWIEVLQKHLAGKMTGNQLHIAGWSTGAIMAAALSSVLLFDSMAILSATPSFCRRPGFPYGQKSSLLKKMRDELGFPDNTVIQKFAIQCGLSDTDVPTNTYDAISLQQGLLFLESVDLTGLRSLPKNKTIFHGNQDIIIPAAAGKYFSNQIHASYHEMQGGHVFFRENVEDIQAVFTMQAKLEGK